jgi:adenylate cyclase
MVEKMEKSIRIDLNQFKLHVHLKHKIELTLHFDSPSRRFYLSVIALVVNEMKKIGKITSIPLERQFHLLSLLNESVGGSAGSSDKEHLLPRIYKKWKDALPNLEDAPLFKVLGRKKEFDDGISKTYPFTEAEKDNWANLFEYKGSLENVRLRFSIDRLGASLDDVVIIYDEYLNAEGWEKFVLSLKEKGEEKAESTDLVPEGPEATVSQLRKQKIAWPSRYWWVALSGVIGIVVAAITLAIWRIYLQPPDRIASSKRMALPLPDKPSIAVLPFANMTGDPGQEYFCDGLSEEIITALSKTPKLFVIARNSTFTYKGKSIKVRQVAEELGVGYVLEGSVRKAGDRVRITSQLTDALRGHHLWAERYERGLKDIFALQDDITKNVITAVHIKLTEGEQARIFAKGTKNLDAYLKVREATWYMMQTTRESILKAQKLAEEALVLDPNYADAYRALGGIHGGSVWLGMSKSPQDSLKRAIELLQKAVSLDESLAVGHASLGYWLVNAMQYDRAIAEGERAMALEPNSADVLNCYAGILYFSGRGKEAIPSLRPALRLNPMPPNIYYRHFAIALRDSGQYDEAIAVAKKAIEREPNDLIAYIALTSTCWMAGRKEEAQIAAREILRINPKFSVERYASTQPLKDKVAKDRMLDALRNAGLK